MHFFSFFSSSPFFPTAYTHPPGSNFSLAFSIAATPRSQSSSGVLSSITNTFCTNTLPSAAFGSNTSLQLPIGSTFIRCFSVDSLGLRSPACTLLAMVVDDESPALTCPQSFVTNPDANQTYLTLTQPVLSVTDNVDVSAGINRSCIIPNNRLTCNPNGSVNSTNITCFAIDSSGNPTSCAYTVGVADTQPPTISGSISS
jgi:hypothetical protein